MTLKNISTEDSIANLLKEEVRVLKFNNKLEYDLYLVLHKYPGLYINMIYITSLWPNIKDWLKSLFLRKNEKLNYYKIIKFSFLSVLLYNRPDLQKRQLQ